MTVDRTAAGDDAPAQVTYEALRSLVLAGAVSGRLGLVVLRREGLAAWVARRSTDADPIAVAVPLGHQAGMPPVFDDIHAGLVRVLASMALGRCRKEKDV